MGPNPAKEVLRRVGKKLICEKSQPSHGDKHEKNVKSSVLVVSKTGNLR